MGTPSSSTTSASPPMAYLQPNTIVTTTNMEPLERERRKKAVQKFLARAEISMITRALRARLSYASYKATHNIPHISLRDLESQTQIHTTSSPRTVAGKRKASGNNYYNNPATQGSGGGASAASSRRGVMAPPPLATSASRSHYPNANGNMNRAPSATQNLFTSILSPPPMKQARTIHNPSDPPVAPSSRPSATPRSRRGSKSSETRLIRSIAEGTRAQARSRREEKSAEKRKDKRSTKGKQKERFAPSMSKEPGDDDMKAVATLTSLLMQSRPSVSGSTSSPRSDTGSNNSYSLFAQSSARTTTAATTALTTEPSFTLQRPSTPPSGQLGSRSHLRSVTPNPSKLPHAPADSEAADHLLFLASSPSPARPTTSRDKDAKDMAAFRALSGGSGLRATGRVLFPGAETESEPSRTLAKSGESSFTLSMSSIGSEMVPAELDGGNNIESHPGQTSGISEDGPATPLAPAAFTPQQLLPPPPSPSVKPANSDSSYQPLIGNSWPSFSSMDPKSTPKAPRTPGSAAFNFNDFINVSPSPAAASPRHPNLGGQLKSELSSLRRKLFEEDEAVHEPQVQVHSELGMLPLSFEKTQGREFGDDFEGERQRRVGGLGAGIDLVHT